MQTASQEEINAAEWADPDNWTGGPLGVYRSRRDSRVLVPKRSPGLGWTLNFARRESWVVLALILVLPVAVIALSAAATGGGDGVRPR